MPLEDDLNDALGLPDEDRFVDEEDTLNVFCYAFAPCHIEEREIGSGILSDMEKWLGYGSDYWVRGKEQIKRAVASMIPKQADELWWLMRGSEHAPQRVPDDYCMWLVSIYVHDMFVFDAYDMSKLRKTGDVYYIIPPHAAAEIAREAKARNR